jgi:hypothetical protein
VNPEDSRLEVVNWPRRIVVGGIWSVFPLLLFPALFSEEPAARVIALVFVIPAVLLWVWLWCWSARLVADADGVRIYSWLPWVRRWTWSEVEGFRVVEKRGQLPILVFAALEISRRGGGKADAGEISQLGEVESAVTVLGVARGLEMMRRQFPKD